MTTTAPNADALLRDLFQAALTAVTAETKLPAALPQPPKGRTVVIGAGKAAAAMAKTVENHWPGPQPGATVDRDAFAGGRRSPLRSGSPR